MGERYTTQWNGWSIVVWMYSVGVWCYVARGRGTVERGTVSATNRADAARYAVAELGG